MSAQLAIVEDKSALVDSTAFQSYLKANLTSDLVLQVLEECLLQENSTYNSIDFEQAIKDLQQKDAGRYQILKLLIEGFATKEGLVMLDPKMVTASYKQRMVQLEILKRMGAFRRFFYRLGQAIQGLLSERSETEAIQEAIQLTGEVQIARDELTVLELKKSQAVRDTNKALTDASSSARKIIESANARATEASEKIYKEGREAMFAEREQANGLLRFLQEQIANKEQELNGLPKRFPPLSEPKRPQGYGGYSGFSGYPGS